MRRTKALHPVLLTDKANLILENKNSAKILSVVQKPE